MKVAAAVSHVNHPKEKGWDRYLRILRTLSKANKENKIIIDSRRMNRDWASRAVSGVKKLSVGEICVANVIPPCECCKSRYI